MTDNQLIGTMQTNDCSENSLNDLKIKSNEESNSYSRFNSSDNVENDLAVEQFFKSPDFYENAKQYWSQVSPTIDGVLGGLSIVDSTDIQGSTNFLNELFKMKPTPLKQRALDCGAGIGRVTKNLLLNFFSSVDLVEQDEHFVRKAKDYLSINGKSNGKIGTIFNEGLQSFEPKNMHYDIIWCQWVLAHLTDDDLHEFFKRCASGLALNGCLVIKENFTPVGDFSIDSTDSSVTRSLRVTKQILESSGYRIIRTVKQKHFIQGLFPVYTIACKPIRRT